MERRWNDRLYRVPAGALSFRLDRLILFDTGGMKADRFFKPFEKNDELWHRVVGAQSILRGSRKEPVQRFGTVQIFSSWCERG